MRFSATTRLAAGLCLAAAVVVLATGCGDGGEPVEVPTGQALFDQAEQKYMDYRSVVNEVQVAIFDGPWEVGGDYGMLPTDLQCEEGEYKFHLTRTVELDPADYEAAQERARVALADEGFSFDGQGLGSGEQSSVDLVAKDQLGFSEMRVAFFQATTSVTVWARTDCAPGDRHELSNLLFSDESNLDGYLPKMESPSDPLFFGITPGDPQFVDG